MTVVIIKKSGWWKFKKWPPFKIATKMLIYIEPSDKHTYLGLNFIKFFSNVNIFIHSVYALTIKHFKNYYGVFDVTHGTLLTLLL